MKKFLALFAVVAFVICGVCPASAKTWTVSGDTQDEHGIRYAVEHSEAGDTIEVVASIHLTPISDEVFSNDVCGLFISSDKNLTLTIDEGCELSSSTDINASLYTIHTYGTLSVTGKGRIVCENIDCGPVYEPPYYSTQEAIGLLVGNGAVNVGGNVTISSDCSANEAEGVWISGGTVNVADNVLVSANGYWSCGVGLKYGTTVKSEVILSDNVIINADSSYGSANGVYVGTLGTPNVQVLDNVSISASGVFYSRGLSARNGTITVLGAKLISGDFYVENNGAISIFAGTFTANPVSSVCYIGADSSCTRSDGKYIVTNNAVLQLDPKSLDITKGKSSSVSVALLTADATEECLLNKIEIKPVDGTADGIATKVSYKDDTITFTVADDCKPGKYGFKITCFSTYDSTNKHAQTTDFTVNVKDIQVPESGSGGGGGCNAGFGALGLAALAVIAAKRRK